MIRYWLTPVVTRDPLTLGADRICCASNDKLNRFRERLYRIHPRCLMLFKANVLVSDDAGDCGTTQPQLDFDGGQDIVFDSEHNVLSHCAESFIARLPEPEQVSGWLGDMFAAIDNIDCDADDERWSTEEIEWLQLIRQWNGNRFDVILIRER